MNIVKCKLHWSFARGQQNIPCIQGIFHKRFFHCNSSSMEITFCCHTSRSEVIAMKFCTAVLSWHVQNFVAMWYLTMELHSNQVSIKFELRWKNHSRNGPQFNTTPDDGLAPIVARSSAVMIPTLWNVNVLVLLETQSQRPAVLHYQGMMQNIYIFHEKNWACKR